MAASDIKESTSVSSTIQYLLKLDSDSGLSASEKESGAIGLPEQYESEASSRFLWSSA